MFRILCKIAERKSSNKTKCYNQIIYKNKISSKIKMNGIMYRACHIIYCILTIYNQKTSKKNASAKILRNDATLLTPSFHSFTRTPRCIDRGSGRDAKGISRNLVWDTFNQLDHHWLRNNRWLQKKPDPQALGFATTYSPKQVQLGRDDLPWYLVT